MIVVAALFQHIAALGPMPFLADGAACRTASTPFALRVPDISPTCARRRAVFFLDAAMGIAAVASLAFARFYTDALRDLALSCVTFWPTIFCISAIVVASALAAPDADAMRAIRAELEDGVSTEWNDLLTAQEALRDRERELSLLVDMVPSHLWRLTPEGEPIFFNKRMVSFLGVDVADTNKPEMSRLDVVIESVHPQDAPKFRDAIHHSLLTGTGFALRYRLRRADGVYRWMSSRAEPARDKNGRITQWYGLCHDIDDQVRAEQALRDREEELRSARETLARASQAASLAELSASIAHEVNQPLAAVVANSHACRRWLSSDPPNMERAQKTVDRIVRDANSVADVVSRIRALFKPSTESRSYMTLSSAIGEAHELMAEEAARRRLRMEVDIESNLPLVAFDRVQIQQVLTNLIRNGMDAMESIADDRVLWVRVRRSGDAVRTEISDRGTGIESPQKIFEPFFTTKAHGMGMGLAICRSIVESHGGRLWAESNEPQGATFIFTLPVEANTHHADR